MTKNPNYPSALAFETVNPEDTARFDGIQSCNSNLWLLGLEFGVLKAIGVVVLCATNEGTHLLRS